MNPLLPDPLKVEKPIGGISALEPISFLDLAIAGIHWVQNLDAEALSYLDSGMLDEAYTQVRRGTVQLDASANSIGDAEERGEIDSQRAQQARLYVYKGRKLIDKAKNIIGRERKKTHDALLRLAQKLIENAEKQLELALSILQGSDAPPLTRTVPKEF